MDAFEKVNYHISKFVFPAIFAIIGLVMLIKGSKVDVATGVSQTSWFFLAGMFLLFMGILMGLQIAGLLKKKIGIILMPVLLGIGAWFAFMNFKTVQNRIATDKEISDYKASVKQTLLEVREVQMVFKGEYGMYSNDLGQLREFLEKGKIKHVISDGRQPSAGRITTEQAKLLGYDINSKEDEEKMNSMNEEEAIKLGLIERPVMMIPAYDFIFTGYTGEVTFTKNDATASNDSVATKVIEPHLNIKDIVYEFEKSKLGTKRVGDLADLFVAANDIGDSAKPVPVFLIKDMNPLDPFRIKDTMMVGSLKKHNTEGNWRD